MARITVLGGTGYAGSNIVATAAARGHQVLSYSRSVPATRIEGVEYRTGDVSDPATQEAAVKEGDVVVSALSPRGQLAAPGTLRAIEKQVGDLAEAVGVRFGVVGGAGSLLVAEGGPTVSDTPDFPESFRSEAAEMASVLEDLRGSDEGLDWFFVSPAAGFGAYAPGTATGVYRIGGDVLLVDGNGQSNISGADLALAIVTEIEQPRHHRARFTVAY